MLSLETARKLKEAGLKWEPKLGDWYYYESFYTRKWELTVIESEAEENAKCFLEADLFISAPRLDQMLAEIEKRKSDYRLSGSQTMEGKWLYKIRVWGEGEGWDFIGNSPNEAAAAGLIWMLELENNNRI